MLSKGEGVMQAAGWCDGWVPAAQSAGVAVIPESCLVWKKRCGPYAFLQHNVAEGLSPTMSHKASERSFHRDEN